MLKLNAKTGFTYRILKKSLDARKKPELFYTYSVAVEIEDTKNSEETIVKRAASSSVLIYKEKEYRLPAHGNISLDRRTVIVGAGPAGLFCAYILAEAGFRPIVIERGSRVEKRTCDVQKFWESGILNPKSNVQFGEGGAGTFSDGKLNTSVKDPSGRNRLVLETFVRFGADPSILYDYKPHIGTDVLSEVIVNMREFLVDKGVTFVFDTCVNNLDIVSQKLLSVYTDSDSNCNSEIKTDVCVLALGHSARDTFDMLYNKGFDMECKSFAVGFRVEHPQRMIDESQYGIQKKIILPPSPYKVTSNFPNGRGVYSFCMCPGGFVVPAASGPHQLVVNGMSPSNRGTKWSNSGMVVELRPEDLLLPDLQLQECETIQGSAEAQTEELIARSGKLPEGSVHTLAVMHFQEKLEQLCWQQGNMRQTAPSQRMADFINRKISYDLPDTSYSPGLVSSPLHFWMPKFISSRLSRGFQLFGKSSHGFLTNEAVMIAVETRTSAPIRIVRDNETLQHVTVEGLFPCGEGAGYAGGIVSAGVDGERCADAVAAYLQRE